VDVLSGVLSVMPARAGRGVPQAFHVVDVRDVGCHVVATRRDIVRVELPPMVQVYFEAGDHEHLVRMATQDFVRVLGDCPHGHFAKAA
jgi:hypothetical protein